jgi:hypothetical protein
MDNEPTELSPYLPATSPEWAIYYRRAKQLRRLGKGQHARIQRETKRRRRQENMILVISTAALVAVIAAFWALLGTSPSSEPGGTREPEGTRAAQLLTTHA